MRNGLNISGVSEIVHEIREKPAEAIIIFNTTSREAGSGVEVTIDTAHHGTFRMARDFRIDFTDILAGTAGLTAVEGAVAALGACVLVTHVHGYTARGISITSLRVRVSAEVDVDAQGRWAGGGYGLRDVRLLIDTDAEGAPELLRQVTQFTTCFSPNHRAFLDPGEYELTSLRVDPGGTVSADPVDATPAGSRAAVAAARQITVTADLSWEYGTEMTGSTGLQPGGEQRRQQPRIGADQSKQMLGIDRAPNPQEWLLAAVSAALSLDLTRLAAQRDLPVADVEVVATGRLDIRGMMNVGGRPARFHELRFLVRAESPLPGAELAALVTEAAAGNPFLATLRAANTAAVRLRSGDEELLAFRSDAEQVATFLAELSRMQAAQGASTALATAPK